VDQRHPPLYQTLGEVAGVWLVATLGYYTVLPALGFSLSYNTAPFIIGAYFFVWFLIATSGFRSVLSSLLFENRLWVYAATILATGVLVPALLVQVAQLTTPYGVVVSSYSDLFFATPWYFLPKVTDILLQQTLIAVIVLALAEHIQGVRNVALTYAVLFVVPHVALFALSGASLAYATIMTAGALASAAAFPYLILKVRNGFVYTFVLHLLFYFALVLSIQTWPPIHTI